MNRALTVSLICLITLVTAIWFCGCGGAKVVHVESDPAFTYEATSSSVLTVVGVVAAVGDDEYQEEIRNSLPRLLSERIAKKREDLTTMDPGRVEQRLGQERYQELLDRYELTGQLDTNSVVALFDATRGLVRYVVLARIEVDSIARTISEDEISTDYKTLRFVQINFQVYDIETAPMVFTGTISHEDFDLQIDAKSDAPDDDCSSILSFAACIFDFLSWFEDKDEEGFPPPPELEDIVTEIFDRFAETLPQAPSR